MGMAAVRLPAESKTAGATPPAKSTNEKPKEPAPPKPTKKTLSRVEF